MFDDLPPNSDTGTPQIIDQYYLRLQSMSKVERFLKCLSLSDATKELVRAGVLHRHPGSSPELLRRCLAANLFGEEIAIRFYGWSKEDGY
jgi:hypothetical protein